MLKRTAVLCISVIIFVFSAFPAYAAGSVGPSPINMPDELTDWQEPKPAIIIEKVECKSGDDVLRGVLTRPGSGEKPPVVIMLHGFLADRDEHYGIFEKLAKRLASNGIASVRFDFGGTGKSDGHIGEMSIMTELDDARAILEYVKNIECVDGNAVSAVGMSLGGVVLSLLAAEDESGIRSICIWAPAGRVTDDLRYMAELPEIFSGTIIGETFIRGMRGLDFFEDAAGYGGNVMLVYGNEDGMLDEYYIGKYEKLYPGAGEKVVYGAGHLFKDGYAAEVVEATAAFFEN